MDFEGDPHGLSNSGGFLMRCLFGRHRKHFIPGDVSFGGSLELK
jgi:hypothetical protein